MDRGPCFHGHIGCSFCPPPRRPRPRRCASCGHTAHGDLCRSCARRGFLPLALFYEVEGVLARAA